MSLHASSVLRMSVMIRVELLSNSADSWLIDDVICWLATNIDSEITFNHPWLIKKRITMWWMLSLHKKTVSVLIPSVVCTVMTLKLLLLCPRMCCICSMFILYFRAAFSDVSCSLYEHFYVWENTSTQNNKITKLLLFLLHFPSFFLFFLYWGKLEHGNIWTADLV